MLIDSHCHLIYLDEVDRRLDDAREAGVGGFLCVGVKESEHSRVRDLVHRHRDVWGTAGIHPDGVGEGDDPAWVERAAQRGEIVAVGETGLDYFRLETSDEVTRARQRACFAAHLGIAARVGLPVVVHTRDAAEDTLAVMRSTPSVVGVMHCFTETWSMASAALDLGYYVSMSGIVTFKNADQVRDVACRVPDDRLLVETDAPWLAPAPKRGKPNEPSFVVHTARYVAELRGVSIEVLARTTTENFFRLFSAARRA